MYDKKVLMFSLIGAILGSLSGCATPKHQELRGVRLGMEKDQVLELAGSPNKTEYFRDKQRWTYFYYRSDERRAYQVHFKFGEVVCVGRIPPRPSPLEQLRRSKDFEAYSDAVRMMKFKKRNRKRL